MPRKSISTVRSVPDVDGSKPFRSSASHPLTFPTPTGTVMRAAASLVIGRSRRFGDDARREIATLKTPLKVTGQEYIPTAGPCLVTVNHYARPGFWAWWLAFAVSSVFPATFIG